MVERVVVGAHYGLGGWLAQRVTAVVMAAYTVLFVGVLLGMSPVDYGTWKAVFSQGWLRLATLVFIVSVLLHAWVGVRDVLMDYVRHAGLRLTLQVIVILALVGFGGWGLQILWRV